MYMDNSTIIVFILMLFFFLKYSRKCNYRKKENFVNKIKHLSDKRDAELKGVKIKEKILTIADFRKAKFLKEKAECYGKYSKMALAGKTEMYIKDALPLFCSNFFDELQSKFVKNTCSFDREKARSNTIKSLQKPWVLKSAYKNLDGDAKVYQNQFNSLYNNWKTKPNEKIKIKYVEIPKTGFYDSKKFYFEAAPEPNLDDQFDLEFNYKIKFGSQFNTPF